MVEVLAIAAKVPEPKVTSTQAALTGSVRCVQVIPSGEVAAIAEFSATATKVEAPKVTECQPVLAGSVRCVQVIPSGEVTAVVEP